jgi:saccharopine dehydrogenase (NAD+, L-lysine forming)
LCSRASSSSARCARTAPRPSFWQTAINPLIALELIDAGTWSGCGVLGPEAFDAAPFLDLRADYGAPHGVDERAP